VFAVGQDSNPDPDLFSYSRALSWPLYVFFLLEIPLKLRTRLSGSQPPQDFPCFPASRRVVFVLGCFPFNAQFTFFREAPVALRFFTGTFVLGAQPWLSCTGPSGFSSGLILWGSLSPSAGLTSDDSAGDVYPVLSACAGRISHPLPIECVPFPPLTRF